MPISYTWRGGFASQEVNALHAEAFGSRVFTEAEWDWRSLVAEHSLGWVTARDSALPGDDATSLAEDSAPLVGFVNVVWDGLVHAWIQDTMVASAFRSRGIGSRLIDSAREACRDAGCHWLHVDFEDDLTAFYIQACGFTPTAGGLIHLSQPTDR